MPSQDLSLLSKASGHVTMSRSPDAVADPGVDRVADASSPRARRADASVRPPFALPEPSFVLEVELLVRAVRAVRFASDPRDAIGCCGPSCGLLAGVAVS